MQMKREITAKIAVLALAIGACGLAKAQQPSISIGGHIDANGNVVYGTELAGQVSVKRDISFVNNEAFSYTPVHPLKKGDVLAAKVSQDEGWSVAVAKLLVGGKYVDYPALATIRNRTVYPAVLKTKLTIQAGAVIHSGGYIIEVKRPVKIGDTIPVVCVGDDAVLSVGAGSEAEPWFSAFKEGIGLKDRAADVKAWRTEKNHVHQ